MAICGSLVPSGLRALLVPTLHGLSLMDPFPFVEVFERWLAEREYPCIGARAAVAKKQLQYCVAGELRSGEQDDAILLSVYRFLDDYHRHRRLFSTLVVIFPATPLLDEACFEAALWQRLEALHALDARRFPWAKSVSSDPAAPQFALSLGGNSFFVVGIHPGASRRARRFERACLVFNLHDQFERLRESGKFDAFKTTVRARDRRYDGSPNPMLADFGQSSEARQYSGRQVEGNWRCPFQRAS